MKPSGQDSVLPMQGAWIQSMAEQLRFHIPHGTAKKKDLKLCFPILVQPVRILF